ncbi:Transcription factor IIIA [Penicillium rolfsii]|nr:Transcription factor IIIA [Penicillium rolfsii]
MALKRKASADEVSNTKRRQQHLIDHDDPIYEEMHSDAEYSGSETPSLISDDMNDTPATPISTTSSRYPSELKTHRCPFEGCSKAFNRPARLQEHIRSHNNERIFQCAVEGCEKSFLRASHLQHHVKSAHTAIRDYVCDRPGCGKSFVTGSRLRRHLAAHDGRDKYRCTEYPPCDETFRKHSTLQKHIITVHLHQKPFPCTHVDERTGEKCQMAFDTAGNLRAHKSRVHTEKRFSCTECIEHLQEQSSTIDAVENVSDESFTFPTYALLQAHIRTAHPPKCPKCPITCSTSRELRRHLEVAHGDVSLEDRKIFTCTFEGCDRSFTKKGNLTVHIRTFHEGEKRFACGETDLSASKKVIGWDGHGCGKRYGTKLALEEHVRTSHMGYKNSKAERRERLGLTNKPSNSHQISTLAALTGQGYAEETGRHIACFEETCEHRFHRDYDLWVHMNAKHGCSEDQVQALFMQRALLSEQHGLGGNSLGIYGLEFDQSFASATNISLLAGTHAAPDSEMLMHSDFSMRTDGDMDSMIPSHDELALMDTTHSYQMMEE